MIISLECILMMISCSPRRISTKVRALCRAKALAQAAGQAGDPHSVPAGTYLEVHVADVSTSAAAAVVQRLSDSLQVRANSQCTCKE